MPPRIRFDMPTLTEHLNARDPIALVLRAHLYIEAILLQRIEGALTDKKALDLSRMKFSIKIKLARALGKIDAADAEAFGVLNKLRNKFAHNLETHLTDEDEKMLNSALTPERRGIVNLMLAGKPLSLLGRLRCDLIALIIEHD